ncbi:retrotransposable element Tf2 [Tanacetum coccineum]
MERLRQDLMIQRLESSNAGRDRNLEGGMRGNSQFSRVTKIEFLKFRGENVRGGCLSVSSSSKLITLLRIARNAILKRFDVVYDDPLGEVKKLKQTNQVQEYIDAFDRLLCRINLVEDHCISFFLAGLNSEIELAFRKFKPRTLAEVYGGPKPIALPAPNATWRTKPVTSTPAASFRKQLTQKEVEEKRAKNQFLGDTMPKLVDTELEEEVLNSEEITEYSPHISLNAINDLNTAKKLDCQLTHTFPLQVEIDGGHQLTSNYMCKRFGWKLHGEEFHTDIMLIPLGECEMVLGIQWLSTLGNILSNFKELRIEFKHNGRKVVLRGTQKANLQWMQGSKTLIKTPRIELSYMVEAEESKVVPLGISRLLDQYLDVFAIPTSLPPMRLRDHKIPLKEEEEWNLECADYRKLNNATIKDKFPIHVIKELIDELHGSYNFKELRIEFKHNGRKVVLRGTQKANLQWMQGSKTLIKTPGIELSSMVLCVYPTTTLHMIEAEESKVVPPGISRLLGQYLDVFAIPTSLPPIRPCDHKIPLKEGTVPITSRPYRYPPTQKDAIEVMVKELLDTRVIKDSQSLFSSLVVMYFTNLDLKSGYHQIRMNLADVEKTSFKTHEGHYEFFVMPFGLINAPSTFQALINLVFKEYLRKFVLVFFDDILVYNPTVEAHVQHLETILQALR